MKKIALILAMTLIYLPTTYALDMDRYIGIGVGNVAIDNQSNYSDGKSAHIKLGLTEELGFGVELEYSKTLDSLSSPANDLDITTSAAYLTYIIDLTGAFRLKPRYGALDISTQGTTTGRGEDRTRASYGVQINYEPVEAQVYYLDYTVSARSGYDLVVLSVGIQYFW